MDVTPLTPPGIQLIQAYGEGRFRVAGIDYQGSILVSSHTTRHWPVTSLEGLDATALETLLAGLKSQGISVLLLGCGPYMQRLEPGMREAGRRYAIVVEPMDTGAACRTFNVLAAEGRPVAAALIAV